MRAYALVQGSRRKFIAVSESTTDLWIKGAYHLIGSAALERTAREHSQICRAAGMYLVRVEFTLGAKTTLPRKRRLKEE